MKRYMLGCALVGTCVVASSPARLGAQVQPPAFPTMPSGVVEASARDARFGSWKSGRVVSESPMPRLLASRSASLVIATNVHPSLPDLTAGLLRGVGRCRDVLGLADQAVESASTRRPWAPFDAAVRAPALVLTLQAEPAAPVPDCISDALDRIALSEAAISLDGGLPSAPALSAAVLRVDGRVVQPLLVGRSLIRTLSVSQAEGTPQWQLRLYVAIDDIVPRADGDWPTVALEVYREDGSVDAIALSTSAVAAVLRDALPWAITRAVPAPNTRWVEHRSLSDPTLRRAVANRGGELAAAGMLALFDTVRAGAIRPSRDLVPAEIVLGEWLAAAGDSASVRLLAADLRAEARCLRISPESGSPLAAYLSTVPDSPACQYHSRQRTLVQSLALPGFGQAVQRYSIGRRAFGVAVFAGTAVQFSAALAKQSEAQDAYDTYKSATTQAAADLAYDEAEEIRIESRNFAKNAMFIWAIAAAENYWYESRRRKRLVAGMSYGQPRTVRVGVIPTPTGALGVGVSITH